MATVTISSNTSWYLYNFRASSIVALRRRGFHVVCLSPDDEYSTKLIEELDCEWLPLTIDNQGSNPLKDLKLVYQFWNIYRKLRPVAVLHFTIKNNIYGTWAATVLGIPVINNVSGLGTAFIRKGFISSIVRFLYKTSQPRAFRVFCQNPEDQKYLVENNLIPAHRLQLLPGSGVDLNRFHPSLRKPHEGSFRFLFAGRMLADKGVYELVDALTEINSSYKRCCLWLVGFTDVENVSAISRNKLSEWDKRDDIEWLGSSDAIEEVLSEVDCVILPSYREGMPRSLLEAGAMGLPVIATDVPGCRSIVEHNYNGLLCEAKSSKALASSMRDLLELSSEQQQELGLNGRTRVEQEYGEQLVVNATIEAVESAAELSQSISG